MKKFLLITLALLMMTCTVQKRRYQPGFYVSALHHPKGESAPVKKVKIAPIQTLTHGDLTKATESVLEASATTETPLVLKETEIEMPNDSCDVLVFRDGSEIQALIEEVGTAEVKYRRCDNATGPLYATRKSELFMLKYRNGTKEVMKAEPEQVRVYQNPSPYKYDNTPKTLDQYALFSLLLGIISFISFWLIATGYIMFALVSIAAMIFTFVYTKKFFKRQRNEGNVYKGKGLAITGMVFALITLTLWAFIIAAILTM